MLRRLRVVILVTALGIPAFAAAAALGHVEIAPDAIPTDSTRTVTFTIPHGCAGSPTTRLAIRFPAAVETVEPRPAPTWTSEVRREADGGTVVTWSGGTIADGERGVFRVRLRVAADAGEAIFLPAVQTCEEGRYRWIQVPSEGEAAGDLATPAPRLALLAPEPDATAPTTVADPMPTTGEDPTVAHASPETAADDVDTPQATAAAEAEGAGQATVDPLRVLLAVVIVVLGAGVAILLLRRRRR